MAVRRIIHKVTYYYKLLIIWPHLISPTSFPQAFMKEPTFLNVPLKIYFFFLFTFFSFMRRSRLLTFKRMLANYYMISDCFLPFDLDCSQSPIFSWDRLDIPRLTVTAILIFKCTEGAGVGDYRSGGGEGGEKFVKFLSRLLNASCSDVITVPLFFSLPPKPPPPPK